LSFAAHLQNYKVKSEHKKWGELRIFIRKEQYLAGGF